MKMLYLEGENRLMDRHVCNSASEKDVAEKLYIVMPAYNEEENIQTVARQWHAIVHRLSKESKLVIVDDGSTDRTYQKLCSLLDELSQLVVLTKPNAGHGATVFYAYHYALEHGADYIFQTDSDGQTLPEEFWDFWDMRQTQDAVIGCRVCRQDGISRIFVTKVLKLVLKMIFGLDIADANTPFRLMNKKILETYLRQIPENFNLSNVMLTVLFLQGNERVKFLPITFRARQGGVNSINLWSITKIGYQAVKDFRQMKYQIKGI